MIERSFNDDTCILNKRNLEGKLAMSAFSRRRRRRRNRVSLHSAAFDKRVQRLSGEAAETRREDRRKGEGGCGYERTREGTNLTSGKSEKAIK